MRARRPRNAEAAPAAPTGVAAAGTRVLLGIFGAPHGLRGEIRVKSYTGDPEAIGDYGPLTTKDGRVFEIVSTRPANEVVIAKVKGVTDRDAAARLTNLELYVSRDVLGEAEDEDEFFHADLIGLRAETADGTLLGEVAALHDFGAGDMIEIRPARGKPLVFAFTKAVVPVVDIAGGRVVIAPPPEVEGDAPGQPRS